MDESVESFMILAENDMSRAEAAAGDDDASTADRAFHSQQAVEKAIKAALVVSGVEPPWIHDVASLADRLPNGWDVRASKSDLEDLTQYATRTRYDATPIPKIKADRALDVARVVMSALRPRMCDSS